jgi:hypothetical protein
LRRLDIQVSTGEFGVLNLAGCRRCEFDDATASASGAEQIPLTAGQFLKGFVFPELMDGLHKRSGHACQSARALIDPFTRP